MIIVSDTTAINYLVLIGEAYLPKVLFEEIIIPQAVNEELRRDKTPIQVRDWIDSQAHWLNVMQASQELPETAKALGKGEREAIALAVELKADAILLDDKRAKIEARSRNISVITILNILEAGAQRGLVDLSDAVERLRQTNFLYAG
jgi:predicted nucleic acid-binding protein